MNTFIRKYSDEELSKLRSTNFNEYRRHRRFIASTEKIKKNKNVSQAFMDSVDKEYQSSPTSVLVNDRKKQVREVKEPVLPLRTTIYNCTN